MSFTIKNLDEVKDSAPEFGFGELGEARFAHAELGARDTGFSFHRVKPDCKQAFAHRHDEAEEVYVVIGGSGAVRLDDETREIRRLDAIRVAPSVVRTFRAGPEGLELLAFGPRHEGDGELLHGDFWG